MFLVEEPPLNARFVDFAKRDPEKVAVLPEPARQRDFPNLHAQIDILTLRLYLAHSLTLLLYSITTNSRSPL